MLCAGDIATSGCIIDVGRSLHVIKIEDICRGSASPLPPPKSVLLVVLNTPDDGMPAASLGTFRATATGSNRLSMQCSTRVSEEALNTILNPARSPVSSEVFEQMMTELELQDCQPKNVHVHAKNAGGSKAAQPNALFNPWESSTMTTRFRRFNQSIFLPVSELMQHAEDDELAQARAENDELENWNDELTKANEVLELASSSSKARVLELEERIRVLEAAAAVPDVGAAAPSWSPAQSDGSRRPSAELPVLMDGLDY